MLEFVQIPNEAFNVDSPRWLSPEELYVLYFLHLHKSAFLGQYVLISIDIIASRITLSSNSKQRINKNKIRNVLLSLEHKKYIAISGYDKEIEYNTALDIILLDFDTSEGNFTQIYKELYFTSKTPEEFMVRCIIEQHHRLKMSLSYLTLAKNLKVSQRHVKTLIKEMEAKGLISVQHGEFYNTGQTVRQLPNRYKNSNGQKSPSRKSSNFVTFGDMLEYKLTGNKEIEEKIKAIRRKETGRYVMDKLEKQVEEIIGQYTLNHKVIEQPYNPNSVMGIIFDSEE